MFISKSKKLVKPKAPSRRSAGAVTTDAQSQESTSTQKPTEPEREIPEEVEDGAGAELFVTQPTSVSENAPEKRREGLRSQKQGDSTTSVTEVDVRHDSEILTRTRPGKRRGNTPALPPAVSDSNTVEAVANVAESAAPLTPPATQVAVEGHSRKSNRAVNPKAPNRRQNADIEGAQAVDQSNITDTAANGANSANPILVDDTDDIARRLLVALANHEEQSTSADVASSDQVTILPESTTATDQLIRESNDAFGNVENIAVSVTETAPTTTKRSSRKRKQATLDAEDGQEITPVKNKRSRTKKSTSRLTSVKPTVEESAEVNEDEDRSTLQKVKGRKRKRAGTPEDAATYRIDPTEVRMDDLINNPHHGQISQREQLLRQRNIEIKERKLKAAQALAREQLQEIMTEGETTNQPDSTAAPLPPNLPSRSPSPDTTVAAPQFRIVNGQIVADESSRIIDRHAERTRAAEAPDDAATVIEEDDLSRRVNSRSFAKYDKPTRWSPAATKLFYDGLQCFGLEFSMMACLFPGRSRRQLKAKFIREERADVAHVNALLKNRKPIPSREELEAMMGKKLKDPKELAEELRLQEEALEEAQRVEDEKAEERRLAREKGAEEEGRRVQDRDDGEDEEEDEDDDDEEQEEGNQNGNEDGSEQEEEERIEEQDEGGQDDLE